MRQGIFFMLVMLVVGGGVWTYCVDFFPRTLGRKQVSQLPSWVTSVPIAHRGLHGPSVPENSLAAFQRARERGVGIELDVQLTKDGVPVVFHDETLERLTGVRGLLAEVSLEQLSSFRLLGGEEKIPTLQEVLDDVGGHVPLYIEIKNLSKAGQLEEKVYEVVKNYQGPLAIISFNSDSLAWFREKDPRLLRGQTAYAYDDEDALRTLSLVQRFMRRHYLLNFLSQPHFLIYDLSRVSDHWTLSVLKKGKPLITYGACTPETILQAQKEGHNYMFDEEKT